MVPDTRLLTGSKNTLADGAETGDGLVGGEGAQGGLGAVVVDGVEHLVVAAPACRQCR